MYSLFKSMILAAGLKIRFLIVVLIFVSIVSGKTLAEGSQFVTFDPFAGDGNCSAISMSSQDYPSKWETYIDSVFKTTVRRFTDKSDWSSYSSRPALIQYSTFTCGNADNSKVVFKMSDRTAVFYDATNGSFLRYKNFGPPEGGDMELRWSYRDPDFLFYRRGTVFYQYQYSTDISTALVDFSISYPWASSIMTTDKGEQSWNDRYWAWKVRDPDMGINENYARYLVCYDRDTGAKWDIDLFAYYNSRGWTGTTPAPRYVTMSPSGDYVIASFVTGGSNGKHTALFQREGSGGRLVWVRDLLQWETGHPAWGFDVDGNEVLFRLDSPSFYMYDLATGERTTLLHAVSDCPNCTSSEYFTRSPAYHLSTSPGAPGWVFYSSYDSYSGLDTTHWLDRVVFAIRASSDPSKVRVWRIAHTRGMSVAYNDQCRTQVSQDGKYIYFDSNWLGNRDREIFRAELPNDWISLIDGISPNIFPKASASATPVQGDSPLTVNFSGSGSDPDGTIVSYAWDFGDGSNSNAQNPTHVYNIPGSYTATLTVTDNDGAIDRALVSISINTRGHIPTAKASASPTNGVLPLTVSFSGSGSDPDGTIVSYAWDFGDGSNSNAQNPTHVYNIPGSYTATLTVTDNDFGTGTTSVSISVERPLIRGIWRIMDAEESIDGPSVWSDANGTLVQSSNIYSGSRTSSADLPKLGSFALCEAGGGIWTDYRVELTMRSEDNDAMGVMFRYQDSNNYYRFSWDRERAYRRLVKCENGQFTLLAQDTVPYTLGQTYKVEILARGTTHEVWVDGSQIFAISDSSFSGGKIALYSWGNEGSYFDDVLVEDLSTGSVLLWSDFNAPPAPSELKIIDSSP